MITYVWTLHVPDSYADEVYVIVNADTLFEARKKAADYIQKELSEKFWANNKWDIEESLHFEVFMGTFTLDNPFN